MNEPIRTARGLELATLVIRHHPIVLLMRGWLPALMLLSSAVGSVVLATVPGISTAAFYPFWLLLVLALFVVGALWAAGVYLAWGADVLYLTEHRLIEDRTIPYFKSARRELRIERIQSVEIERRNLLMTWAGCADLVVSIAGAESLRFAAARAPLLVREQLLARQQELTRVQRETSDQTIRASVAALLEPPPPRLPPDQAPSAPRRQRWLRAPQIYFGHRIAGTAWRRHRWFLIRSWIAPLLVVGLCVALPFILDTLPLKGLARYDGALVVCGLVAAGLWMGWLWADWRNDHYVITPNRIIEIEQLPLGFRQQISEAALDRVEDIRYDIPHPWAHLLDYGNVTVHTASAAEPFIFRGIARPRHLAAQIDTYVAAAALAATQAEHRALQEEFSRWLIAYGDLRTSHQS